MSQRPKFSLKDIASGAAAPAAVVPAIEKAPEPAPVVATITPPAVPARAKSGAKAAAKPAGKGTLKERSKQMALYLEPPVYDQLRELAFVERTKIHPLILEGIDLLFQKKGLKRMSALTKDAGQ